MPSDENRKFDPEKRKKLNNPTRLEWLPPARIWELAGGSRGDVFVDIGAGTGYLTGRIAGLAGPQVTIHALDIEPLMVAEMEENPPEGGPIRPQLMERDSLPFADGSVDGVWMIALYHELQPPAPLLTEIRRVLRSAGRLLIIDWEKSEEASGHGPPLEHRVTENEVCEVLMETGFNMASRISGFRFHYGILAMR